MTNIERYLSGDVDYGDLTNAERCAICAAMEGCFPIKDDMLEGDVYYHGYFPVEHLTPEDTLLHQIFGESNYRYGEMPWYLLDGTAALRLVERFRIDLTHVPDHISAILGHGLPLTEKYPIVQNGPSAAAAIVHTVCSLARAQWPYKGAKA